MGKKKLYKLAEHEHQYNRVDIFRAIQLPDNLKKSNVEMSNNNNNDIIVNTLPKMSNQNNNKKSYTNETYVSSNNDIAEFSNIYNIKNKSRLGGSNTKQQNVWTTSSSIPSHFDNLNDSYNVDKDNSESTCCTRKTILIIVAFSVALILIAILATIGVILGLKLLNKPTNETIVDVQVLQYCPNGCDAFSYCVNGETSMINASCQCRPGYSQDRNKVCQQNICYTGYFPYTYLNNDPSQNGRPYQTKFITPYCCPNPMTLTNACCGVSHANKTYNVSKRIIGGSPLGHGTHPWLVYVAQVYRTSSSQPLSFVKNCSGTLLNDKYVITAAHCLDLDPTSVFLNREFNSLESIMRVYFGFVNKTQVFEPTINTNYERRVYRVIVHPKYNQSTLENDLAMIQLDRTVQRDAFVDYLCLFHYSADDSIVDSLKLYTAGWGSTNPNYNELVYPDVLHYVDATIFPMAACTYILDDPTYRYLFNPATHICAGYQASFGKDTCYGDSGSPLMVELNNQWFIYGLVTFGSQPNCAEGPSMYIRISYYYDWIKAVIQQ